MKKMGIGIGAIAAILWILPLVGNRDIFPETRICFRVQQVLKQENIGFLSCDSNQRVGIILSSIFDDLDKNDIEFHQKVATDKITKHFGSNLQQTQLSTLGAIASSIASIVCFSEAESKRKADKNNEYQNKRVEILQAEANANLNLFGFDKNAATRQRELNNEAHILSISEIQKETSKNDLETLENKVKMQKALHNAKVKGESTKETNNQQLINQLVDALKQHEEGWLYTIIKNNKPLWLIGSQGSGKTNTAACIAIIRQYCFDAPVYQLIDRHATGENWKVWQLLNAQIKAESESEIGQALEDACERWLARIKEVPKQKQQLIIDEFTNLKKIPSCKEAAMKFFSMHLTDTRKAKEFFIGINHYFTNESTVEGTFEARKAGTIQIKKFSANGETPLPRIQIVHGLVDNNGNELEEVEGTLPNWFEAVQIYDHFNGKPIEF
jgi:hypothetical protein